MPNPYIEFLKANGRKGKSRATLLREYHASKRKDHLPLGGMSKLAPANSVLGALNAKGLPTGKFEWRSAWANMLKGAGLRFNIQSEGEVELDVLTIWNHSNEEWKVPFAKKTPVSFHGKSYTITWKRDDMGRELMLITERPRGPPTPRRA